MARITLGKTRQNRIATIVKTGIEKQKMPIESGVSRQVGLFLIEGYSATSLGAVVDCLSLANDLGGHTFYQPTLISVDGKPVRSSGGLFVTVDCTLDKSALYTDLFIITGNSVYVPDMESIAVSLRNLGRHGCRMCSVSGGVLLMARAGLLENRPFTIHWELRSAFAEEFPKLSPSHDIFVIAGNCLSCAGGASALDLALWVVAEDCGWDLTLRIAEQLVHPRIREGNDRQRQSPLERFGVNHPSLIAAIEVMNENLAEPVRPSEIARRTALSLRQLEQLFKRYLDSNPSRFYLRLRLERARNLLLYTPMPIIEVAIATGFNSHSYFTKAYRLQYGATPTGERAARRLNTA
ncbi:MAG: GlxA family transcriptional regulator [Alphaproteobacteria bacterium]